MKILIILLLISNNGAIDNNDYTEIMRDKEAIQQEFKAEEIRNLINLQY